MNIYCKIPPCALAGSYSLRKCCVWFWWTRDKIKGLRADHTADSQYHHSPTTPLAVGKASLKVLMASPLWLSVSKSVYLRIGYDLLRSIRSFVDMLLTLSTLPSSVLNCFSASCPSLLAMKVAWPSFRSPKNFTSLGPVPAKVKNTTVKY